MLCIILLTLIGLPLSQQDTTLSNQSSSNWYEGDLGTKYQDAECRDYHHIHDSSKWCNFVNITPNCAMDEGFVNYINIAFCDFKPKYLGAVSTVYAAWLIFLFVGLGTTAEGYFCPSLEFIAHNLKLSQNIAGLTIVAFGNGSPDIFSAIAAFTNPNPTAAGVAIGALLGAAMLVTTVVAGLVATTQSFDIAQRPFLRDMIFFIATVFWLFCLLYNREITLPHSVGFLCLYICYVAVVVVGRAINQRQRARRKILEEIIAKENEGAVINSVPAHTGAHERTPLLAPDSPARTSRNRNNNNIDSDGDWVDVHLRLPPTSHQKPRYNLPGENADEHGLSDGASVEGGHKEDDDEETEETDFTGRSFLFILMSEINPIKKKDWLEANCVFKVLLMLQVPWNLVCKATIPLITLGTPRRGWNRPLNCLSLIISPLFCVFATRGDDVWLGDVFPLWGLLLIIGAVAATIVWFTSNNLSYPVYQWIFAYFGFVVAIIWTYTIANEIVNLLQTFGVILNVSNVVMGLTFLAFGNSIGDVVADVALAKQGFPRMSWSACFGGPLFNLLIGVGLPCTISIIRHGSIKVAFTHLEAVLCGGVIFSLCFTLVVIPYRKFKVTPVYGGILICIYVVFLAVAILAGVNVI